MGCEFPGEECKCNWISKVAAVGLVWAPGSYRREVKGMGVGPALVARAWGWVSVVIYSLGMGGT